MKVFLIAVATALIGLVASVIVGHRSFDANLGAERVQVTSALKSAVSSEADTRKHLERAIVRAAERERWWMLFVGITLVSYCLLRKHQALFDRTILYSNFDSMSAEGPQDESVRVDDFDSLDRARSAA
jgi:hypothetical protein